jgi:ABC-type Zn2+ transport system substrate-binding protein/surface adhesin
MRIISAFFSLLLLLKALLPAMDTAELAKLPLLIEHYRQHRALDDSMNFLQFLAMHYTDARHHEEDHTTHSHLPFGQHHHLNVTIPVWNAPAIALLLSPPEGSDLRHQIPGEVFLIFSFAAHIWQPPRLA